MEINEGWQGYQEILIILAHPDDPEYFLGGASRAGLPLDTQSDMCF